MEITLTIGQAAATRAASKGTGMKFVIGLLVVAALVTAVTAAVATGVALGPQGIPSLNFFPNLELKIS